MSSPGVTDAGRPAAGQQHHREHGPDHDDHAAARVVPPPPPARRGPQRAPAGLARPERRGGLLGLVLVLGLLPLGPLRLEVVLGRLGDPAWARLGGLRSGPGPP